MEFAVGEEVLILLEKLVVRSEGTADSPHREFIDEPVAGVPVVLLLVDFQVFEDLQEPKHFLLRTSHKM